VQPVELEHGGPSPIDPSPDRIECHLARGPTLRCDRGVSQENQPARPPTGVGLEGLRAAAAGCRACELWEPATQTVFGEGPETARVVFVGEMPGDQEDRTGEPFVGPAGRVLDRALADAGIDRSAAYVTNAVKHFFFKPTPKRRLHQTPKPEHLRACRPWLEAEFEVLKPEIVVCLGATAAKALISPSFRITKDRGTLMPWMPPGVAAAAGDDEIDEDEDAPSQAWMLATTHPSAILRTPDEERAAAYDALVADLKVVAGALA
jgi:DNA polymerase